jgi:hypothetical protein
MDQNGMSNSHRGPSIDTSYQVSVYLAKLCQSRRFLEIDQSKKRIIGYGRFCIKFPQIRMKGEPLVKKVAIKIY